MNTIQSHNNQPRTTLRGVLASTGLVVAALAFATSALAGCGSGIGGTENFGAGAPSSAAARFTGNVHGGQQPLSGASIQVYAVNTGTLKGASTALITGGNVGLAGQSVSAQGGGFNITGLYTCPTPSTDIYLVASGGDPNNGVPGAGGTPNSSINLVAALGDCATVTASNIFININELSTAAAAYSLAPFAADLTHIGSGSQAQLTAAFNNVNELYYLPGGTAGGGALAVGTTAPVAQLNTVGNILSGCVNNFASACTNINSATSGTETFSQALGFAKNPGAPAVVALVSQSPPSAPFQPSLAGPPDFTMVMNYAGTAGALNSPFGIAIDVGGNAWVTNEGGSTITELSPTNGSIVTTQTATNLFGAQGIAIDRHGNVWVANTAGNSVVEFAVSSGSITGSSPYTTGITAPTSIALDSAGNAFVSNLNGGSITKLSSTGVPSGSSPYTPTGLTLPSGIALDAAGNVYVTSGSGSVLEVNNGLTSLTATLTDNALQGPLAVAVDPSGNIFATGSTTNGTSITGSVAEISATGTASSISPASAGLATPFGVATDGTSVWVANSTTSGSLAQLTYGSAVPVSPTAGFGSLNTPVGVAIDNTGSIWTTNSGSNTISKFIGLANPVATPVAVNVGP